MTLNGYTQWHNLSVLILYSDDLDATNNIFTSKLVKKKRIKMY